MFPLDPSNPKDKRESGGFYIDPTLKMQLDYYIKNVVDDWDFTIIICGEGEVRVGKSLLAMQIAAYWTDQMWQVHKKKTFLDIDMNFVFNGRELIKKGNYLGKNLPFSALIFDEAGADLEGVKAMKSTTQAVRDFLRECGQYNLLNILVLPEFFDLPRGVAISRSACLLNVFYLADKEGYFERGYFKFYSRPNKKMLYLKGKKDLNYKAWRQDFFGRFYKFYPIDEQKYRLAKQKALATREKEGRKTNKHRVWLIGCLKILHDKGVMPTELAELIKKRCGLSINPTSIHRLINDESVDDDEIDGETPPV